MLGNRLNKYISGCHILCLRWLRTNVHASASMAIHGRIQRGDNRSGPSSPPPPPPRPPLPPEKSQKYRVFQQYGSKLPSKHSMSSHHRHASESPFKWRFTGGPMMARLNSGIWILPSKKKTLPSWTPSGDTFWIRAWAIYNAPVICNHCFTPAPEQDGDIHSLVNVLCFYCFIVPTMWRKCCGLIDIDKHGSAV